MVTRLQTALEPLFDTSSPLEAADTTEERATVALIESIWLTVSREDWRGGMWLADSQALSELKRLFGRQVPAGREQHSMAAAYAQARAGVQAYL